MNPGLCTTCAHARPLRSARGSIFWRCAHPEQPKYPRLPVLACDAHAPAEASADDR
jgi:hypothetical protein